MVESQYEEQIISGLATNNKKVNNFLGPSAPRLNAKRNFERGGEEGSSKKK